MLDVESFAASDGKCLQGCTSLQYSKW